MLSRYFDTHKETIRTVDSIVSIVFQVIMLGVQLYGLRWIMTHTAK